MPNTCQAARTALSSLATGSVEVDMHTLLSSAPVGDLAKEAAVLILFGALDSTPASSHFAGCPQEVSEELDVLLLVRASTLRSHAGQPAFPGGKIDPEDYEQAERQGVSVAQIAALREANEETGLNPEGVEILGQLPALPLPVSDFMVTPVIGWWRDPSDVQVVDFNESALIARVPVRDLLNPANRHMSYVRRGDSKHLTPAFRVEQDGHEFTVWGFTAMLLDSIFNSLGWSVDWDRNDKRPAPGFED